MNNLKNNPRKDPFLDWGMIAIKVFVILIAIISVTCFFAKLIPNLLVNGGKDLKFNPETGVIGDTIGGTLGPFVAIIAAVLTYIAFKIQYDANIQQKNDLAKERFENKFFEMLRLHKECLNEISITGITKTKSFLQRDTASGYRETEETTSTAPIEISGRDFFSAFYNELVACYSICREVLHFEIFSNADEKRDYLIKASYRLCFSGANSVAVTEIDSSVAKDQDYLSDFRINLEKARVAQMTTTATGDFIIYRFPRGNIGIKLPMGFKLFSGHVSRLGHYYRNLFMMVKFVVEQDKNLLSYKDKREYLRMLRAQLSTDEQLMLFFNYLSGYGYPWENDKNRFFSDYRMIHNLPLELTRFAADPRSIFKKQIDEISLSGERMFEYDE